MPVYNKNKNFQNLALVCAVNNRAQLVYQDDKFGIQGEPTEAAMKVLSEKIGRFAGNVYDYKKNPQAYCDSIESKITRLATLDFSSERKTMSTVIKQDGKNVVLLKGAPERVVENCSGVLDASGNIKPFETNNQKQAIIKEMQTIAAKGFRVLGVAMAPDGGNMKHLTE